MTTTALVFGRPSDLFESILAEFQDNDVEVVFGGTLLGSERPLARLRAPEPDDALMAADSILVVVDDALINELFGDDSARNGKLVRSSENRVCERVTGATIATVGRRLLVVCDVRRASVTETARAIRWVRCLALRIRYECSVNGLDDVSSTYAVVADDTQLRRTAAAVVDWHRGPAREYR